MPAIKKTTKLQLEKKLMGEADKLGLKGKARSGYIYGVLRRVFPAIRAKKKIVARQANPAKQYVAAVMDEMTEAIISKHRTYSAADKKATRLGSRYRVIELNADNIKRYQVNPIRKRKARHKNPVDAPNKQTKIQHAMALFKRFRLDDPEYVDNVKYKTPEVGMVIGDCDGILYTTVRDGKTERYKHEFKKSARPLLVASWDGKQILIVGGSYNFTQDGITDM